MASGSASAGGWGAVLLCIDRGVAKMEIAVASLALAAGLFVSLYTIGMRALVIPTAEWVLELPMELLVVASIYGSGALISRNRHLMVDIVVDRLPERARRFLARAVKITLALLCAFLAERGMTAAHQAARAGLRIPELFNLPTAVLFAVAAAGLALWSLHYWLSLLPAEPPVPRRAAESITGGANTVS